ncbi:MAG: site-specific DNA-methyltransferase [Verrucomicrobiota bacterium]
MATNEELLELEFDDSPATPTSATSNPASTCFNFHLEDCVTGMAKLPEDSVDLVVTSPPYNLGIDYGKYEDNRSVEDYLGWSKEWANEVRRILKPDGSFFLNIGASPANPLLPHQLLLTLTPELFTLQNTFHWVKSITVETRAGEEVSAGHFKPINSKRFVNDCHEFVYHFTLEGNVPLDRRGIGVEYVHKSNISRWGHTGGQDKRCRGNNWFVPYETIQRRSKERPHPATFPVKLASMCIGIMERDPGIMTMLDPFLGIGHAAIAAGNEGIGRFIGFEIDKDYFQEAEARLASPGA